MRDGPLLPRPRPRADRRLPRAPGRPLRRGGRRDLAATGKPILTATELAVADPANPGPGHGAGTGRLCYASANRAVTALGHLYRYAEFRRRRGLALSSAIHLRHRGSRARSRRRARRPVAVERRHSRRRAPKCPPKWRTARGRGGSLRSAPVLLACGAPAVRRDVVGRNLRDDLEPVTRAMGASSCLVVQTDGVELVDERRGAAGDPGQQHEARHRGGCARACWGRRRSSRPRWRRTSSMVSCQEISSSWAEVIRCSRCRSTRHRRPTPPFNVTSLEALADRIVAAGVRQVNGGIVGDD